MKLTMGLGIYPASVADVSEILALIHQKAAFDDSIDPDCTTLQATEEKLRHTLFNDTPFARVILVRTTEKAIGFALYYFQYSSFAAQPSIWLDDLYLEPEARGQGIGKALMIELAKVAQAHHCTHIAWTASKKNSNGIRFYQKLGAEVVGKKAKVLCFQAKDQVIQSLILAGYSNAQKHSDIALNLKTRSPANS
jgi:GNAT superfamily N-acetyltransferase